VRSFLQKCASKSYFNLLKCSGPWSETLKTVNNVTMMINNKLAVLSFTLHHVERITKKKNNIMAPLFDWQDQF